MTTTIVSLVLGAIIMFDIVFLIVRAWGAPQDFMYYLCRPL